MGESLDACLRRVNLMAHACATGGFSDDFAAAPLFALACRRALQYSTAMGRHETRMMPMTTVVGSRVATSLRRRRSLGAQPARGKCQLLTERAKFA